MRGWARELPSGVVWRGGALARVADRGGVLWAGLFGSRFGLEVRVLALARPSINRRRRPDDTNATRAALSSALITGVSEAQAPTPPRARARAHGAPRLRGGVRNRRFGPRAAGARSVACASRPDRMVSGRARRRRYVLVFGHQGRFRLVPHAVGAAGQFLSGPQIFKLCMVLQMPSMSM